MLVASGEETFGRRLSRRGGRMTHAGRAWSAAAGLWARRDRRVRRVADPAAWSARSRPSARPRRRWSATSWSTWCSPLCSRPRWRPALQCRAARWSRDSARGGAGSRRSRWRRPSCRTATASFWTSLSTPPGPSSASSSSVLSRGFGRGDDDRVAHDAGRDVLGGDVVAGLLTRCLSVVTRHSRRPAGSFPVGVCCVVLFAFTRRPSLRLQAGESARGGGEFTKMRRQKRLSPRRVYVIDIHEALDAVLAAVRPLPAGGRALARGARARHGRRGRVARVGADVRQLSDGRVRGRWCGARGRSARVSGRRRYPCRTMGRRPGRRRARQRRS